MSDIREHDSNILITMANDLRSDAIRLIWSNPEESRRLTDLRVRINLELHARGIR